MRHRHLTILALCFGLAYFAVPPTVAAAQDAPATFPAPTLMDPEVKFRRANDAWMAETYLAVPLKAKGATRGTLDEKKIGSADPRIHITASKETASSTDDLEIFKLDFTTNDAMPPAGGTRYLIIERISPLAYTVAKAPPTPTWAIEKIGPIAGSTGDPIPITVTTGDDAISGLNIVPNTLFEKNTERPLGTVAPNGNQSLWLCRPDDDTCANCDPKKASCFKSISIPARSTQVLNLMGADKSGHYTGSVIIATREGGTATSNDSVIDLTTTLERTVGLATIALGVIVSTFGMAFLRSYQSRIEAMRDARIGIERIDALSRELAKVCAGEKFPNTTIKLEQLKAALNLDALKKNGLGKYPVSPSQTMAAGPAKVSPYILGIVSQVAALELIARNGLEVVATEIAKKPNATLQNIFMQLDKLALGLTPSITIDQAQANIDAVTQAPEHATFLLETNTSTKRNTLRSLPQLDSTLAVLSVTGWVFVIATTILAGAYALLFSSGGNGFGDSQDYGLCLLWGLGLPLGAQALQLTVSSILNSFGVAKIGAPT
jgi:hypothetical protein